MGVVEDENKGGQKEFHAGHTDNDRLAISPPCEVSSTTPQTENGLRKNLSAPVPVVESNEKNSNPKLANDESSEVKKTESSAEKEVKVAMVVETSEKVEVVQTDGDDKGSEEVLGDEEEIDD